MGVSCSSVSYYENNCSVSTLTNTCTLCSSSISVLIIEFKSLALLLDKSISLLEANAVADVQLLCLLLGHTLVYYKFIVICYSDECSVIFAVIINTLTL